MDASKCVQCGGCCEFLCSAHSKKQMEDLMPYKEWKFVRKHWKEVPPRKPHNRYVSMKMWIQMHHFVCDWFDPATKLCKDYENRPDICRRYPTPKDNMLTAVSDKCGILIPEGLRCGIHG